MMTLIPDDRAESPEADDRIERRRRWLEKCGVPKRYRGATREGWLPEWRGGPTPWPGPVDDWSGGDEPILTLTGAPGNGKTHVAVSLMIKWPWERLHRNRITGLPDRVAFVSVPIACEEMRRNYDKRDTGGHLIRGIQAPEFYAQIAELSDLVIFDDFGAQPDTATWWVRVEGWIYGRHARSQPTVITQNPTSMGSVSDHTGRRTTDGLVIPMPWTGGAR